MSDKIGDFIICPYCDYRHPDQCDYPENIDGNQQEMDCDNCGKTFDVIGELSWTFHTYEKKSTEKDVHQQHKEATIEGFAEEGVSEEEKKEE